MPDEFDASPRLVVVGGGLLGDVIVIPPGSSALALAHSGDTVILGDPSATTIHHGILSSASGRVRLTGSGMFGAIAVNGVEQHGTCELNEGDAFNLGNLVLRYRRAPDADQPPGGREMRYAADRDIYAAGRDIHHHVQTNNNYGPMDERIGAKGPGRVLVILGVVILLTGFGLFTASLVHLMASPGDPTSGMPSQIPIGFALALAGGILAVIGKAISRSARKEAGREAKERRGSPEVLDLRGTVAAGRRARHSLGSRAPQRWPRPALWRSSDRSPTI